MKAYVPDSDEAFFERLVKEAPYLDGLHTNVDTVDNIEWLDRDLLDRTKDYRFKHRHFLAASSGIVAVWGVGYKNISLPFMQTGTLQLNPEETAKRIIKHVAHFVHWYADGSEHMRTYEDIQKIKRIHLYLTRHMKPYTPPADESIPNFEERDAFRQAVFKDVAAMNLEDAFAGWNSYSPKVFLSQFDMVMIQVDLIAGFAREGIHGLPEDVEGMKGFMHHWAVIGRLLGIEDRFNLALHPSKPLYERLIRNVVSTFSTMDLQLSCLLQSHLDGVSAYLHLPFSSAGMMYVMMQQTLPEFEGKELLKLMSARERVTKGAVNLLVSAMIRSDMVKNTVRVMVPPFVALTSTRLHVLAK